MYSGQLHEEEQRSPVLDGSLSVKSLKYLHKLLCLYKLEICKHGL